MNKYFYCDELQPEVGIDGYTTDQIFIRHFQ